MLQTKALYNLLRLNREEDPSVKAEPWAIEDLRAVPIDKLFSRLQKAGIQVDKTAFLQFANESDTPEELADLLLEDSTESQDPLYLVLFEIWRRLVPEKQSLSIFGDELDHRISLFDRGELENDEPIQDALANLQEVLDENADAGAEPQAVFQLVNDYCAHDLQGFLVDYISDLLDAENELYASELVDGFSPYAGGLWFDFLKARLLFSSDPSEANAAIRQIVENAEDSSLLLEILSFLAVNGEHELFVAAFKKILPLLKTEEEFVEVVEKASDYFHRLDKDAVEQAIQKIMKKRKPFVGALNLSDPDLKALQNLIATGWKRI